MNHREFAPRRVPHFLLALLHGGLAAGFGVGLYGFVDELIRPSVERDARILIGVIAAVLAALFWLSATACARRITVLLSPPYLRLSPEGVFVRCYRLGWRAMVRPWFRWPERRIAWVDFRGCRVQEVFLNEFVPIKASLLIETAGPPVEITWGMFAIPLGRLQNEMLDYRQATVVQPGRDAARLPEFLAQLFRSPLDFRSVRVGPMEVGAAVLVAPLVFVAVALHLRQAGTEHAWTISAGAVGGAIVLSVLLLRHWIAESKFIQLGSAGLSVGPDARRARLIRWGEMAFARVHAIAGKAPSSLTKLEIRLRNGEAVFIRSLPAAERLAALIDPSAETVAEARRLMDDGLRIKDAARAAGIPL